MSPLVLIGPLTNRRIGQFDQLSSHCKKRTIIRLAVFSLIKQILWNTSIEAWAGAVKDFDSVDEPVNQDASGIPS
jgi:hypothetical protein